MSAIPAGLAIRFKRWDGNADLPVPAYATAGAAGFEQVLDIVEDACRGLLGVLAPATGSRP